MGSSSAFLVICILHSLIAITSGALMMFYMKEVYTFGHGVQTATKLLGSTPHDQLLIKTSDSFSGLLLVAIGFLLFMVSFVKDRDFQAFFAKGCTLLHVFMAMWRIYFERKVEDLAWDWLRQTVGDILLALSWVFFLVYSWREKVYAIAIVDLDEWQPSTSNSRTRAGYEQLIWWNSSTASISAFWGHQPNLTSPSSALCILHLSNAEKVCKALPGTWWFETNLARKTISTLLGPPQILCTLDLPPWVTTSS